MVGERCERDCAFCAQARSAAARDDLLSRVNWPQVSEADAFWAGLGRAVEQGCLRRVCFQLTAGGVRAGAAEPLLRELVRRCPGLPVCVSLSARSLGEVEAALDWGVERVTLAVDAVTEPLYRKLKGGSLTRRLDLIRRAAGRFPGRIGTHLIAGLGETEAELMAMVQSMADLGVTVALFAFTPVPGTRLAGRAAPDLGSYRRLQLGRTLIVGGHTRHERMAFDWQGRLIDYGVPWDKAAAIARDHEVFRTSGCPDCNRPYYNERPGGPLYNYPRPLTPGEMAEAVGQARPIPAWRLIIETTPRPGRENMAVDEAMLLAHARGGTPPTLRFYRWDPPAVSLGYFQDPDREVSQAACRAEGVDIVRRPTGGRAVLHDQEVTYSVVVGADRLPGTVVETYRRLAEGLVLGLGRLGVPVELAPERRTPGGVGAGNAACFEVPSSYEVVAGGRKVLGSAQVRRHGVILQHGAIPLELDAERLARVLGFPPEVAGRIAGRAAGLAELWSDDHLPSSGWPGYNDICRAIAEGLAVALGITFVAGGLEPEEAALADRLVQAKYGLEAWNLRRPEADREDVVEDV